MEINTNKISFSVCIPVYNFSILDAVIELHKQSEQTGFSFEILVIDDCSASFKEENRKIQSLSNVRYIELEENIGRSAIRNKLAEYAQYSYLIFMDCDIIVHNPDYIQNYLNEIPFEVVIGGCGYSDTPPKDKINRLRWEYGISRETTSASLRNKNPYKSFSTFNFMIRKDIFDKIRFDESISGYGHEDTFFGWDLKKQNIHIKHIDNQILHISLVDSSIFISQVKNSIRNLWILYMNIPEKTKFAEDNKLLHHYLIIRKYHLCFLISLFSKLFRQIIFKNLISDKPNMRLFDLYRLTILNEIAAKS